MDDNLLNDSLKIAIADKILQDTEFMSDIASLSADTLDVPIFDRIHNKIANLSRSNNELKANFETAQTAARDARNKLEQERQTIANTVVEWREGCPSGKREFLDEIGLLDYVEDEEESVTINCTVAVPFGEEFDSSEIEVYYRGNSVDYFNIS